MISLSNPGQQDRHQNKHFLKIKKLRNEAGCFPPRNPWEVAVFRLGDYCEGVASVATRLPALFGLRTGKT
jgi:hypothetical protein